MESRPEKELPDMARETLRLKHYSWSTEQGYASWINHYILRFMLGQVTSMQQAIARLTMACTLRRHIHNRANPRFPRNLNRVYAALRCLLLQRPPELVPIEDQSFLPLFPELPGHHLHLHTNGHLFTIHIGELCRDHRPLL